MVRLGEVFWEASVKGADEATGTAEELEDSMGRVASTAQEAAEAQNEYGEEVEGTGEAMDDTSLLSGKLGTSTDLLGSSLFGVAKSFGIAAAAAQGYAAALGLAGAARGGVAALSGLVAGTSLGSLVSKVTFASLLKGAASLGALVIAADTIGAMIDGKDPITAFVTSAEDFGEFILNPIGIENNLVEGVAGIGVFILGTMSIASFITGVSISAMISGAGASIATFLTTASLGTLVAGAGSIALLIGGVASLGDLVDGDISSWNLPAKFGKALGEGFRDAWPNMADTIRTGFTNNIFHDAGQVVGREGTGAVTGPAGDLERSTAAFLDPRQGWEFTGFQSGGMVNETGPAWVHENEAILPSSLVEAVTGPGGMRGGGGGNAEVSVEETYDIDVGDQTLDMSNVNRSTLRELASLINDEIGGTTGNLAGGK